MLFHSFEGINTKKPTPIEIIEGIEMYRTNKSAAEKTKNKNEENNDSSSNLLPTNPRL